MILTNNEDCFNYMMNRGVQCVYNPKPIKWDGLAIIFTNNYHALGVCGNAHQGKYKDEYKQECEELLEWFECCNKVIMISNVIKFGTPYMAKNYKLLQQRYDKLCITKQVIHTRDIGSLILPHYVQLRYKNVEPINFDFVATNNLIYPQYVWVDKDNRRKRQDVHYMNVINSSHDIETRRKQRYLPEYSLFSVLYKKLNL